MFVNPSMTLPPDPSCLSPSEKDTLIGVLMARLQALEARVSALEAENAALREKLNLPPKTPDNASKPPSTTYPIFSAKSLITRNEIS